MARAALRTAHIGLERDLHWYYVNLIARPVHDAESGVDFMLVLFDEVEDSMESDESTHIEFRLSVPDGAVSINADLTRIEQIVWNLVSNAVKFTDTDGVDEALHAGFDAHLTKPVMLDALLSTIARLRLR